MNEITKKILHFADDEKFIQHAYEAFTEQNHVENHFAVFSSDDHLRHIHFPVETLSENFFDKSENIDFLQTYDAIVIHFLHTRYFKLLGNKSFTKKIFWIGWGGDYYWLIDTLPNFEIYKPLTQKLIHEVNQLPVLSSALRILKRLKRRKNAALLNRIDFFSPVLEVDYQLIKKNYRNFKPKFIRWNYGNLEDNFIKGIENKKVKGNKIIIGNSATATNNHVDIFSLISNFNYKSLEIIIPLNYGDKEYGRLVTDIAKKKFPKVYILDDFLKYEDYQNILLSCGNVFMGHIRQQAMGNVITLLYLGAKLFFFSESVVFKYLLEKGFVVFTFDDLLKNPTFINQYLDIDTVEKQKFIANSLWSRRHTILNTEALLDCV